MEYRATRTLKSPGARKPVFAFVVPCDDCPWTKHTREKNKKHYACTYKFGIEIKKKYKKKKNTNYTRHNSHT